MGVVIMPGGKPTMRLTGGALEKLKELVPEGHEPRIHITITDDFLLAQASSSSRRCRPERPDNGHPASFDRHDFQQTTFPL